MTAKTPKRTSHSRFQRHSNILMWKSYLQRQRRWRILACQTIFASILFVVAVFIAKPVFLTPLQAEPEPPLTTTDLLASLNQNNIVGYAPDEYPYSAIMQRATELLQISMMRAATVYDLNNILYQTSKNSSEPINRPVIWVIWKPKVQNKWKFSIRSTERARYETRTDFTAYPNPHLRAGFLAIQLAISQAIIEHMNQETPKYELSLVSMPVSPLMQEINVRKALSGILLCFTLALMAPVLETQALVVTETMSRFKRGLRMRGVEYSSMYLGWLVYAYLTAMPICFLAAITLLLIFRWIHLLFALMLLLSYTTVMILTALIMAMFHSKTWVACVWSMLFTLLQTYLAELVVHHEYDMKHPALTFLMQVLLPPLGFVHALNQFALLQTGRGEEGTSLFYGFGSWVMVMILYFTLLMLLQRTIGQQRAIGGQVSWKSIIFKKVERKKKMEREEKRKMVRISDRNSTDTISVAYADHSFKPRKTRLTNVQNVNELREIETPTGLERDKLQEVDEMVAKAVSFKNVSKSVMGVKVLNRITLDIYRGEFTMLFAERIQEKMIVTIEDLLTGLTFADTGTITVLGHTLRPGKTTYMTSPHMMGYCHRSRFLIDDLTVQEHFDLFSDICLWQESRQYMTQYARIRLKRLIAECDLEAVRHANVHRLDTYYRAQLCWALAMLVEPRVVLIPNFSDQDSCYIRVIKDKIMQHKKYLSLIQMCFSSLQLENADRVFLFDSKILVFGGTPAYMFFKYGTEYRVRMTVRNDGSLDEECSEEVVRRATAAGATVRAHLGSLLILRLPTSPTEVVTALVQDLTNNANQCGVTSLHISVPDSEEVYRRAMKESRVSVHDTPGKGQIAIDALKRMAEPLTWKRRETIFCDVTHLRQIGWKYFTFRIHYRLYFLITLLSAILAGIFMGLSLSTMLANTDRDALAKKILHGEKLTMEYLDQNTNLVLRSDDSEEATSLANAYVLSEPNATKKQLKRLAYTALSHSESLTEYLVTRAIDSPQFYVKMYAYGMDVRTDANKTLLVQALYSPLHKDIGAAARSLAKVYTALLRHYTGKLDASIQVTDDPLALDLTPWMRYAVKPPLFLQFLLILSISHITLIPSMESGLIRHMQCHAMNFSPARYWFTLYFWDLILYWILVGLMTGVMVLIMYLVAPAQHFQYGDLLVVPFMLILYGFACVPQAYLFSLGPKVALNSMTFVIVNIVFGETTVIAKLFYGEVLSFALLLMSLSPQFNMAYAFVKIKQIFLYNSECIIFKNQNLCSNKILHKCCEKCGVLQTCFSRRNYLTQKPGILREVFAMGTIAGIFTAILLLVEYKVVQILWKCTVARWTKHDSQENSRLRPGALREKIEVIDKWKQIRLKRSEKVDTFGEYLLAQDLTRKELGVYTTHGVYLGLGKGEALALSGLKRHGRLKLVKTLAGYWLPDYGFTCCMSKWRQNTDPHMFARQISLSCGNDPLPPWMTIYDTLMLLALLRGVPKNNVKDEIRNLIEALEIQDQADTLVCRITQKTDYTRLYFAAAVIGAPPIVVLDECTAYQNYSVRRAMYAILNILRKRGHAIFISASSVETHLPITSRLAIMVDGTIYDIDSVDNLVARYSRKGFTVVLHLKDEVDVTAMFEEYFSTFMINDSSVELVNVQVLDDLTWATVFQKMEALKTSNYQVYSYIITTIPIDYIYNSIINNEKGNKVAMDYFIGSQFKKMFTSEKIKPNNEKLDALIPFEQKYDITTLKELPWSVIFQT